ncbi:hypothetical protein LOC67_17155 [Stieleria sp. JC731]|uniref:hypothetical protein n=1 Tax=Pirellulaceae TaxID=2691357 RepID=UPI001E45ADCE|nr:hypothetical protein [Stieleria sp. JC731]MCC9602285.1 hypothetical protein [Stieleria sp. JC731]
MEASELQAIVSAIVEKRRYKGLRTHELVDSIHRKRFPAEYLPILEPLLDIKDGAVFKYAIDIVGRLKNPSQAASEAVESAWERSWQHGVPQACTEAFRALIRIGGEDQRLLRMVDKAMAVDNYDVHKQCAMTLMKVDGGNAVLEKWSETVAGQCGCHLHTKLAEKIVCHLQAGS